MGQSEPAYEHFQCFNYKVFGSPFLLTLRSLFDGIFTRMTWEISKNAETRIFTFRKNIPQSRCQNRY